MSAFSGRLPFFPRTMFYNHKLTCSMYSGLCFHLRFDRSVLSRYVLDGWLGIKYQDSRHLGQLHFPCEKQNKTTTTHTSRSLTSFQIMQHYKKVKWNVCSCVQSFRIGSRGSEMVVLVLAGFRSTGSQYMYIQEPVSVVPVKKKKKNRLRTLWHTSRVGENKR